MNALLTPAELAKYLGLATQTIYNRHHTGASLPPCVRLGRLIRFPVSGVEAWVSQQAEKTLAQHAPQIERRLGRPTKAEQIARRRGGAA